MGFDQDMRALLLDAIAQKAHLIQATVVAVSGKDVYVEPDLRSVSDGPIIVEWSSHVPARVMRRCRITWRNRRWVQV